MIIKGRKSDAIVVGSGPNGLSAAIYLAQKGLQVTVLEAKDTIGGGTRTLELTEPGFIHDICSAVHPTAKGSPFLSQLPLEEYGLEWCMPEIAYAHPFSDGDAVSIYNDFNKTIDGLGEDGKAYKKLFEPFVEDWELLSNDIFGNLRFPSNPFKMAKFGWHGAKSAKKLSSSTFKLERTRAMFAGCAAHSIIPLEDAFSSSFGLVLGISAHSIGWPIAKGGSAKITEAMTAYLRELGAEIVTDHPVQTLADIPDTKTVLFDLTPRQIASIMGTSLPDSYRRKLNDFVYGPGAFKMDWALSEPVPWKNPSCLKAGTIHLGDSFEELARSEKQVWEGQHPEKPYVLLSQPSLFDPSRAPDGKHTLWAYCHVPNGSTKDMTREIEDQIERVAPGFRDTIISKSTFNTKDFQQYNENYIGGDINGGAQFFAQLFGRPVLKWNPYKIPVKGFYICSSSTPPGGGVHGMCGYHAAKSAYKTEFDS